MSNRVRMAKGFTLVEILIVVVILGILAAIVIPQFSSASQAARASSLSSQLQTIRSQLELAQIEHQGTYPDLSSNWNHLTTETEPAAAYTAGDASGNEVGPYLQKAPSNPFSATANDENITVDQVTGTTAPSTYSANGWVYNRTTGEIRANIPSTVDAAALGLDDSADFNVES